MAIIQSIGYPLVKHCLPIYIRYIKAQAFPELYFNQWLSPFGIRFDPSKNKRLWEKDIPFHSTKAPQVLSFPPEESKELRRGLLGNKTRIILQLINRTEPAIIDGVMEYWKYFKTRDWTIDGFEDLFQDEKLGLNICLGTRESKLKIQDLKRYFFDRWGAPTDDEVIIGYDKSPPTNFKIAFPKPWVFPEDLLAHLCDNQKPTTEILLLEPYKGGLPIKRSRFSMDFWSALTEGYKLWICFPPTITKAQLRIDGCYHNGTDWFYHIYLPHLLNIPGRCEFLQKPGQIVYVPNNWWFKWISLHDKNTSIAKYFIDRVNLRTVWKQLGGTLPENQDAHLLKNKAIETQDYKITQNEPYKTHSSTRQIDPIGLKIDVWPRWKYFLMNTVPHNMTQLKLSESTEADYWKNPIQFENMLKQVCGSGTLPALCKTAV